MIRIWNLFYDNTLDQRVYDRLLVRLDIFRSALGSIESIVGDDIRQMTYKLFSHNLDKQQELAVIEQTAQALANRRIQEERLEEEATYLIAHGDYIQNKVNAARELKRYVTGEDIYNYVKDFFDDIFLGCRFQQVSSDDLRFTIDLSGDAKAELADFLRRTRSIGKTRLINATNKVFFKFENRVVLEQMRDEIISQFHPVIRFISEYYRKKGIRQYFPVVGVEISSHEIIGIPQGYYIFLVQRWSIKVALRDIEKLAYQVYSLMENNFLENDEGERLVNTAVHKGQDWLAATNEINGTMAEEAFGQCEDSLENLNLSFVEKMKRENVDRIAFQISNLDQYFNKKESDWSNKISIMKNQGKLQGAKLWASKLEKLQHF